MKKILILTILFLLLGRNFFNESIHFNISKKHIVAQAERKYLSSEKSCLNFIFKKMSFPSGGIYTNYLPIEQEEESLLGHKILSESEGLIMLYFATHDDKKAFDKHLDLVVTKMMGKEGLFKWVVGEEDHELSNSSASVDDLRIARSLIYAYSIWKDEYYYKILKKINEGLLKNNIYKDCLTSSYTFGSNHISNEIELSYIDLYTMQLLNTINDQWEKAYNKGLKIIENGYISDDFPLYKKNVNLDSHIYSNNKHINMIDTLLVILHLSEVGLQKDASIKWIKNKLLNEKALFNDYSIETQEPINQYECTAVYAIIARIAKEIGDEELYKFAIKRMLSLQITDNKHILYGAFGNKDTYEVFSFDNLQALFAF